MAELIARSRRYNIAPSLAIRRLTPWPNRLLITIERKSRHHYLGPGPRPLSEEKISRSKTGTATRTENCALPVCPAARLRR